MPMKPSLQVPSFLSWFLNPTRIARHNLKWYTAAMRAVFPLHWVCSPPSGRLQAPPRPLHLDLSSFANSGAFVMNVVGFLTGDPSSAVQP